MKEIGGYFGLEQYNGTEYHDGLLAVNTGRNALAYLIKARKIRKLYIPFYLCDSISNVCKREGCEVAYYHINDNFLPRVDIDLRDNEWLYIVNYYGMITNKQVQLMKCQWDRIIFDNVQAFFQKALPGVDTIYSCRKFFGVPDGAYVATDVEKIDLEKEVSGKRMKHILGRFEETASAYYAAFKENDHSFNDLPVRAMSDLTHNLLRAVDYSTVRKKRNENYRILAEQLDRINGLQMLQMPVPDGPYAYPFYASNGMQIKKMLAQEKIYVATLWPNVLTLEETLEKDYAENILPLPCDQRYEEDDMCRIITAIKHMC